MALELFYTKRIEHTKDGRFLVLRANPTMSWTFFALIILLTTVVYFLNKNLIAYFGKDLFLFMSFTFIGVACIVILIKTYETRAHFFAKITGRQTIRKGGHNLSFKNPVEFWIQQ